jgi:pyrroloquinoline-quinone synthase
VGFFDRLEDIRSRWDVLDHSFYVRWSNGDLSEDELALYAGQYRHAVVALADCLAAAAQSAEPELRGTLAEHAAEEVGHVELWDDFAEAAGSEPEAEPLAETRECVAAWTAGRDTLEGLVAAYAIESGQPAISRTKLQGLLGHYGFDEGPATAYFSLHETVDERHAASSRELIEQRLAVADEERLLSVAEGALRGNWALLDGVERATSRVSIR